MAAIKHTKNELKAQREALARFERYLPMLLLKRQQLQAEIQRIAARIAEVAEQEKQATDSLSGWVRLFSEPCDIGSMIHLEEVRTEDGNIAGVAIPVLQEVILRRGEVDLFASPMWVDDGMDVIELLVKLRAEREVLEEQRRLIKRELVTTTQRVNLFEKVKIPECSENIRIIRIFLGDEQTASVARGKLAKKRTTAR